MTKLSDFINVDINITWKLIDIGFQKDNIFKNQISSLDIIHYSEMKLVEEESNLDLLNIVCQSGDNIEEINRSINLLAHKEESTLYEKEYMKWVVMYVKSNIPHYNQECVSGLIQLGNIWSYLNFPEYSPHIFQGVENKIKPYDYYTSENFNILLEKHEKWIDEQIKYFNMKN